MTRLIGGDGGAISINKEGQIGINFNSNRLAWAYIKDNQLHKGCNRGEDFIQNLL